MVSTEGSEPTVNYFDTSQSTKADDRFDFPEYRGFLKHAYMRKIGHVVLDEDIELMGA